MKMLLIGTPCYIGHRIFEFYEFENCFCNKLTSTNQPMGTIYIYENIR